ncbi:transcription termination factor MTEF1, chloroplastic [Actinidia eriantha]|uniref:transcription termination factor MTEF1, chloroplastic n=1 Tax=Actinidia eriantha TaxID=165200 RepID=UPI002590B586|nr:transcription termination factor MTEF1, chloroplastic [Actinidia eriantha]
MLPIHSPPNPTLPSLSLIKNHHTLSSSSSPPPPPPPLRRRFPTSHRENLRCLKTLKIINPQTNPKHPQSPQTLTPVLSTVKFLKSKGFSDPDFPRLAFLCPQLFSPKFSHSQIEPVFDFLTSDLNASIEESHKLVLYCPQILLSNAEFCLRPTLAYLRELGLQKLNSPTNLNAHLLNTRIGKLEEKIWFLRGLGLSRDESARVCARLPAIFGYSVERNLVPKSEYLVREMKREIEELKVFPQYFGFSLEKRIAPRHLHLKQRNVEVSLKRMLMWSDERFYAKWK